MSHRIDSVLRGVRKLVLPARDRERLGLPSGPLELRRAWPRTSLHLGLEYFAGNGSVVVGQWFGDVEKLDRVAHATARSGPRSSIAVIRIGDSGVLLQTKGADRRLPGLAPLLSGPGQHLVVHRPERRAVVRFESPSGQRYAKVVRPKRASALAEINHIAATLGGETFLTPELLEMKPTSGVLVFAALPGISLYELSRSQRLVPAAVAAGRALRDLHAASPPLRVKAYSSADEVTTIEKWLGRLEVFFPTLGARLRTIAPRVLYRLLGGSSSAVLLHRDFYDKQIFCDPAGRIGLLDFDTMATGEAALDLANALVHFELRSLQGSCPADRVSAAKAALLRGYGPGAEVQRRLNAYADAARLRLACVYTFRPYGLPLVPQLLARIGRQPVTAPA